MHIIETIYDLKRLSEEAGLKDYEVALGDNPQHLSLGEIKQRISDNEFAENSKPYD